MNENHLQQIFKNYIEKFEEINNTEHQEYYKWQIAKIFRPMMDDALKSEDAEFIQKLKQIRKKTENFIDSYTQPFGGLIRFADKWGEVKKVREMFQELFKDDGGDLEVRQKKIEAFLEQSHQLNNQYENGVFRYKDDFHSVTGYLFLYDPDHNYIYKASHVWRFADCVEFYDDFGMGDHVKLKTYYRMCDELVKAMKADTALMATDSSRFENGWGVDPATFNPDTEKHILAFDVIYCCSTYNLFKGITYVRPKTKERQLMQEKKEKAQELLVKLQQAQEQQEKLAQALQTLYKILNVGTNVKHLRYGSGVITAESENSVTINFTDGNERRFGLIESIAGGYICTENEKASTQLAAIKDILKKKSSIESAVSYAEREFAPYNDYI